MSLFIEGFGWVAALCLLAAYFLNSRPQPISRWSYQWLNLVGAGGIVACSLLKGAWQPAFLNGCWMVIALTALWQLRSGTPQADRSSHPSTQDSTGS